MTYPLRSQPAGRYCFGCYRCGSVCLSTGPSAKMLWCTSIQTSQSW